MKNRTLIMSTVGLILTAITAHGNVATIHEQTAEEKTQMAALLADMIEKGFVKVDGTGRMQVPGPVMEILKNYQLLQELDDTKAMSNCQRTGSGCKSRGD